MQKLTPPQRSQIYLHHPRSTLRFASFQQARSTSSSCTRFKTLTPTEAASAGEVPAALDILPDAPSTSSPLFPPSSQSQHQHARPHLPPSSPSPSPSSAPHDIDIHSRKFLRAADHLSNLATLPSAITRRTPFFTCALAMCVVVHTAAFLVVGSGNSSGGPEAVSAKRDVLRSRVQLGFGGLNVLGRVWPMAKTVRRQMVEMGREVGL